MKPLNFTQNLTSYHFNFNPFFFCVKNIWFYALIICSIFCIKPLLAQDFPAIEWENTIGGTGYDSNNNALIKPIKITSDGGLIMAGVSFSNIGIDKSEDNIGQSDVWVVKLDAAGNIEWDNTLGGTDHDLCPSINTTSDGGYIVGATSESDAGFDKTEDSKGTSGGSDQRDYWVIKLDASGNVEWDNTIGGDLRDEATVIKQTSDGGYIIGGYSFSDSSADKSEDNLGDTGTDYWVVKLDALGNIEWDNTIGGSGFDAMYDLEITSDGGYILGGQSCSSISTDKSENAIGGSDDYWVVKLDALGNIEWDNTIGGSGLDVLEDIAVTSDGGYILGGRSFSGASGDKSENNVGSADLWVVKLNASGNIEWENTIGGSGFEGDAKITESVFGGYIVGASSTSNGDGDRSEPYYSSGGDGDGWILKLDAVGNIEWENALHAFDDSWFLGLEETSEGSIYALVESNSASSPDKSENNNDYDYWIVKLNCGFLTDTVINTISPVSQTTCQLATPDIITGTDDDNLFEDNISYQWQISSDSISWSDVDGGITRDYLPPGSSLKVYYRRLATWSCDQADTSNVHTHDINSDVAPVADGGGTFYTCPGTGVTIGGSPTGSGGTGMLTYSWDNVGLLDTATIANPVATVSASTVFTVTVTDASGCPHVSQAVVKVIQADAGEDQTYCEGEAGVQIGAPAAPGPAITYSWTPNTDLSSDTIAQPVASPASETTYSLSMTLLNSDLAMCNLPNAFSDDSVTVITAISGNAVGFTNSGALNPDNALGAPDGAYAVVAAGDVLTLELADDVPGGISIDITITRNNTNGLVTIEGSSDDISYTQPLTYGNPASSPDISGGTVGVLETITYTNTADIGYLRFTRNAGGTRVDAVSYSFIDTTIQISSEVTVSVASPPSANFGGPDTIICLGQTVQLGTTAVGGFNYAWAPALYLDNSTLAEPTFQPGEIFPVPNPYVYEVTASNTGCSFTDEVEVTVLEAYAGEDRPCADIIGQADPMGGIASYQWNILIGDGTVSNATIPQPEGTPGTTTTTFEVVVTYNGFSCRDTVILGPCNPGDYGCEFDILSSGQYDCPKSFSGESFTLTAYNLSLTQPLVLSNYTYQWSPTTSLTTPTSYTTDVTTQDSMRYFLTLTNIYDNSVTCVDSIDVNGTTWSFPTFTALDAQICPGESADIGDATVAGHSYSWTILNDAAVISTVSNPSVTPTATTLYEVTVTEDASGCAIRDTATVTVQAVVADAGPDWTICATAIIQLGTADPSGGVWEYTWNPGNANWQNGTDSTYAQPEPEVAITQTYDVLVTNPLTGCFARDTVEVILDTDPVVITAPDTSICPGSSVQIGSPAESGATYIWSPPMDLDDPNIAQPTASPSSTTQYIVMASFPPGLCSNIPQDTVVVSIIDPSFDLGSDIAYCPSGGGVNIGGSSPTTDVTSYAWSPGTGLSCVDCADPVATPDVTTAYILLVTYNNGCTARDTLEVSLDSEPEAGFDPFLCVGDMVQIGSASNTGAITWTGTAVTHLDNVNSPTPIFDASSSGAGTFTAVISQMDNGCTNTDNVEITVVSRPSVGLIEPTTVCINSCVDIGVTSEAGMVYSWTPSTGLDDASSSMPLACPTVSTNYQLTITNVESGCDTTVTVPVALSSDTASVISVDDVLTCNATPFTFNTTVSPVGTYTFSWDPQTGLDDPYIEDPTATVNSNTTYTVTVTDNTTGCTNQTDVDVTVQSGLTNLIGDPASATGCPGDAVVFSVTSNAADTYTYLWQINTPAGWMDLTDVSPYSGTSTQTLTISDIVGLDGAEYRISATGDNGCMLTEISETATVTFVDCDAVLPVELISFTASYDKQRGEVTLIWSTASEVNSDRFEIERSIDGGSFVSIGILSARGHSSSVSHYQYIDQEPKVGINYYRLRQVDFDETADYSRIIAVDAKSGNKEISVIQANRDLTITDLSGKGLSHIALYSIQGQLIQSQGYQDDLTLVQYTINRSAASGIYILVMNHRTTKKLFIY